MDYQRQFKNCWKVTQIQKQISDLEEIVKKFKTPSDPESINKIHDGILK